MKEQGTEAQRDKGTKRRLFVFGPGIVVALVIVAWVIVQNFMLIPAKYKKLYDTPAIQDIDPFIFESSVSFRFVNFMLNDCKGMGLTPEQQSKIKDILQKCNEELKPVAELLKKEKPDVDRHTKEFMDKKISGKKHWALSKEYFYVFRKYREIDSSYFKQTLDVLTEQQKTLLWEELGKQYSPFERKMHEIKKKVKQ